jgi:hypothetical protein
MNKIVLPLLCALLLGSCSSGHFQKPGSKSKWKTISKTQRHARADKWMQTSIDTELAREKRGERPSASKQTWREYWQWRISLWRKERRKDYEQYLLRRRKEMGLKDVRSL